MISAMSNWALMLLLVKTVLPCARMRMTASSAKHQNCHFLELKEELQRTEKNLKELKLSK